MEAWQDLTQPLTCANSYAQDQEGIFLFFLSLPMLASDSRLAVFPRSGERRARAQKWSVWGTHVHPLGTTTL